MTTVLLLWKDGLDNAEYLGLRTPNVSRSVHNAARCMVIGSYVRDWYGWKVKRDGNSGSTLVGYQVVWLIRASSKSSFTSWNCVFKSVRQQRSLLSHSHRVIPPTNCRGQDRAPDLMPSSLSSTMTIGYLCPWIPVHHYTDHSFTYLASGLLTSEGTWPGLKIRISFWILPSRQNINVALPSCEVRAACWIWEGRLTCVEQNWQVISSEGTGKSDE